MSSGKFITFEGGEGCGKSTQVKRLKAALEELGYEVVLTREPGGTWLGEELRRLIKDQDTDAPTAEAELLLFLAARAQLVAEVIAPALAAGKWVISDRFSDSTVAYQGFGRGLSREFIERANAFACAGLKPDFTFFLDVDPKVSAARRRTREKDTCTTSDRIERAGADFHARLLAGFRQLAREEPERIVTISALGAEEEVFEKLWKSIKPLV